MARKPTRLVIDGDIFFYRAAAVAETKVKFASGAGGKWSNKGQAITVLNAQIKSVIGQRKFDEIVVASTDSDGNFRKTLFPQYKAQRASLEKPELLGFVTDYAKEHHNVVIWERIEADDILGIMGTDPDVKTLIWSADKDLMQIPGLHLVHGKVVRVGPIEGALSFLRQSLTGDAVDNYKGCPGIGPKKAAALLDCPPDEWWDRIVEAYSRKGLTEKDAIEQARVAYILRNGDYYIEENKIKLWNPKKFIRTLRSETGCNTSESR